MVLRNLNLYSVEDEVNSVCIILKWVEYSQ